MLKKIVMMLVVAGVCLTACTSKTENANKTGNAISEEDSTKKVDTSKKEKEDPGSFNLTKVGQAVPDFTVTAVDGKTYQMSKLKGKTVLLIFFSNTCPGCLKELKEVEATIWPEFKSRNIVFLAMGRKNTTEEVNKFKEKHGFTMPMAPDPEKKIYNLFFTKYIPRNVLINKEGKIIYQKQGYEIEDAQILTSLIEQETKK